MGKYFNNALKAVTGFIRFSSPADKAKAVEWFDFNGDGEVGKSEVRAIPATTEVNSNALVDKDGVPHTDICAQFEDLNWLRFNTSLRSVSQGAYIFNNGNTICKKVTIPPYISSLTVFNNGAIFKAPMEEITILRPLIINNGGSFPTTVTKIIYADKETFYQSSVTNITDQAWAPNVACPNASIYFGGSDERYKVASVLPIPDSITSLMPATFAYSRTLAEGEEVDLSRFNTLSHYLFYNNKHVGNVTLSPSLTFISRHAFEGSSVSFSTSLREMCPNLINVAPGAFKGCTRITEMELPDTVTSIGANVETDYMADGVFRSTGFTSFTYPSKCTYVGANTFRGCTKLTDVSMPDTITAIRWHAFDGCSRLALTSLPSGLTSIGQCAFQGCTSLALTELPSGVTSIGQWAFQGCTSLALTELPSGVTSISQEAFLNCSSLALTELPSGVTSIGQCAFQGCTSLALTELPSGVTSIPLRVFFGCNKMPYLILHENIKSITAYQPFPYIDIMVKATTPPNLQQYPTVAMSLGGKAYYVPDDCVDLYKETWSFVANAIKPMSEWPH